MNRVTIRMDALRHNLKTVNEWVRKHDASLTVVTKALCGHRAAFAALQKLGVSSFADSRLENLDAVDRTKGPVETWYLRPPHQSGLTDIVSRADVSLNSELKVVKGLNAEAERQGKLHAVVIMIELGDLREGVLPGSLVKLYEEIFRLPNIEVLGVGANLGCLSGAIPSVDELMQLILYRELLELKFDRKVPLISAGTSAVISLLLDGTLPRPINHFRIGESILLGTDPVSGELIDGLRDDVVTVEAEVVEIKEKRLVSAGEVAEMTPFASFENDEDLVPGQRGYRALVTIGQVDTDVSHLRPVEESYSIAGASSDITVVNVGEEPNGLTIGDTIAFRAGYSSFVRLMANTYTERKLILDDGTWSETVPSDPEACLVPPAWRRTGVALRKGA